MRHFFLKPPKSLLSSITLWASFFHFLSSDFCYTQVRDNPAEETPDLQIGNQEEPKYTVNFNHVSVVEVIRFVSKITKSNFVFEESDLQFNVTILSEEPVSVKNIMSALIQILRIHDLRLLEQEGNLIITKSVDVNQVPSIVSQDLPHSFQTQAPLITRVFRIKNASPDSIASIIKPMVSSSSLIEVSPETRQLIVTDITTNIEKISALLLSLDTPNTRLEIESYVVKNISPQEIISLTQQILSAFAEGNPLILVPQNETNTIFIVSTPYLIERALTVMEDLDIPPKGALIGEKAQDVHIYKILHKTSSELLSNLQNIYEQIEQHPTGVSSALLQALKNVKYVPDTNSLLFVCDPETWEKTQKILADIDAASVASAKNVWIYKIQNGNFAQIQFTLLDIDKNLQNKDFSHSVSNMKWIKENNSIVFTGSDSILEKLREIVPTIDVGTSQTLSYYVFKVEHNSLDGITSSLEKLSEQLDNPGLNQAVKQMKRIEESHSLVFNAPANVIQELQNILPTIDVATGENKETQSYIYQVQHSSGSQILSSLKQMAHNVEDKELADAMLNGKWIAENNSIIFNGSSNTIAKLQSLLPTLDVSETSSRSNFIVYTPVYQDGASIYENLKKIASDLSESGLENKDFLKTLQSAKWTPSANTIVLTGDSTSLEKAQKILNDLDKPSTGGKPQVFIYSPKYVDPSELKDALDQLAKNLNKSDPSDQTLAQTIQNAQWIAESNSFLFKADSSVIDHLQQILSNIDNQNAAAANAQGFFLYKLQQAPGNIVIQNLKSLTDHISSSDLKNANISKSIQSLKWVKESNSILITGSPQTIDLIKTMIAQFDVPSAGSQANLGKSEFFIYKPVSQQPEQIQKYLEEFSKDLELSDLNDPAFLSTLKSARFVPASKSLVFTGTPESIAKLKTLLASVDSGGAPIPIQTIGQSTFLIYKIQHSSATELLNSLQTFAKQIGKTSPQDKELAASLNSAKWIKETNSILFTGTEQTLHKVEKVLEKFDITSLQTTTRTPTSSFFVYNPKYQSGSELIHVLNDFKENLIHSGIADPSLFDAIAHLKYIEKTNSLIISGTEPAIQKIQELLTKFDVLGQGTAQPEIASIDNTNFLIYKLQYHKGMEIQTALKKVAASISRADKNTSKALVDCIDSLQWIEVTNSLLGTGEPGTLEKVKALIHNLDVPLKQVFIEILVIETSVQNSQNFGLQWGSQLQYLNKTIGAMGNFPTSGNILQSPLSLTTAANPPVQGGSSTTTVPFTQGFDLGIIGDIIFHKGQSFLSLGSLLNALQADTDSTIVMNPKIVTQDGHTSNIFVGLNIPFVGSFVSNTSSNTTETSNIEYRDVGFNLVVTPTLGTNDIITLDINQDISQQVPNSTLVVQNATVSGIETTHTTMTTRVHVPDRHFLVLSGMMQDTKSHARQGLPCLGGLPMIGALFANNQIADSKLNVIIFMKPYILHSMEEYQSISDQEETLYKEDASLPDVKETIDAAYEMVKSIE